MKVYLASWFSSKELIQKRAEELRAAGVEVTSRWLEETLKPNATLGELTAEYMEDVAEVDIADIVEADKLVLFTVHPERGPCHPRCGRMHEAGYFDALVDFQFAIDAAFGIRERREFVVCGPRENIFHYRRKVRHFETWEETRDYLIAEAKHEKRTAG